MVRSLIPWEMTVPSLLESGPRDFRRFRREMDRLLADLLDPEMGFETRSLAFSPQMNVAESDKEYEITIDLPGVKQKEITVELRDGNLVISGERKEEHEEKGVTYRRIERECGQFCRAFPVGPDVKPDQINANFKDGVLRVTLPKTESVQAKRIPVKS